MPSRTRIRPGKAPSLLGLIVGLIFIGIGVLVIMPVGGPFGLIWTLAAAGITIYYAVNLVSARGVSLYDIETDRSAAAADDVESRLRRLERLRADGLISEAEYEHKRAEIMRERW